MVKFKLYDPDDESPAPRREHKSRSGGFTMDWMEELGWSGNPFTRTDYPLAGMEDERKEINLFFVKKRKFGVITGTVGTGKSTIIRWLSEELDGYPDIDSHFVDAGNGTDVDFLQKVWKPFKPTFGGKLPASHEELAETILKKANGRYVLLVDNAHHLEDVGWTAIQALLNLDNASIIVALDAATPPPHQDELGINLKKPSGDSYEQILSQRIAAVGGHGIAPFTSKVIKTMTRDTENAVEFLSLAEETAINIALKHAALDDDTPSEDLADAEEEKAAKKKGIRSKDEPAGAPKGKKKREYDALIESLIEDD